MKKPLLGGVLLIVGTSIGGGMLALPMAVATVGYQYSSLAFIVFWLMTMLGALFILEVNLWFPDGANLVSMAREALGKTAQWLMWFFYLLLLYTLMAAYTAGGSDLVHELLHALHLPDKQWLDKTIFAGVMAGILYFGVFMVDRVNRVLMSLKFVIYFLLVFTLLPHINGALLSGGGFLYLKEMLLVIVTAFGYAGIVPTLRTYFKSDVRQLRRCIIIGSAIPLLCYLVWDFVVEGSIASHELASYVKNAHAVTSLTGGLSSVLGAHWLGLAAQAFTSLCISTSFLGVGIGVTDFIADGLGVEKKGWSLWLVLLLTIMPPLVVVLIDPSIFVSALAFAGFCCVFLLIFMPTLMVYVGRKKIKNAPFTVPGGRSLLWVMLISSVLLLIYAVWQLTPMLVSFLA